MAVLLFLVFIVLPLAELFVIIQVGQAIGVLPTLALMLLTGIAGAYLARSQGRAIWQRFNAAMSAGKVPAREVFDGAMILFGGALLLSPGFITDLLGIMLLVPPGRHVVRGMTRRAAARTPTGRPVFFVYDRFGTRRSGRPRRSGRGAAGSAESYGGPDQPGTGGRPTGPRDYDLDGTAREIDDPDHGLPSGPRERER